MYMGKSKKEMSLPRSTRRPSTSQKLGKTNYQENKKRTERNIRSKKKKKKPIRTRNSPFPSKVPQYLLLLQWASSAKAQAPWVNVPPSTSTQKGYNS